MEIEKTILEQLGGHKFVVMTGAKNLTGGNGTLSFKIGRNAGNITHVRVTLDVSDTYTMQFLKIRAHNVTIAAQHEFVYADQLQAIFTSVTGMATKLF